MSEGIVDNRIVYRDDGGRLIIVTPAANSGLTVEQVAERDVPAGAEYEIVSADDLLQLVPSTPDEVRAQLPALTRRQLRLTLVRNGIALGAVAAMIEAMPDGLPKEEARIEWDDATTFERLHPTLIMIGDNLGLTPEEVDMMWQDAVGV